MLALPIACTLGLDCHNQRFVDRDPGPGVLDHACGGLANDGHKGTDFAVSTLADMAAGVPVLAAASGRVRGLRDGMPDIDASLPNAPDISGRECGNGVLLDHGDGWVTQYCHLREGSVRVHKGETVQVGDPLGLVGMSGEASFPHVHFAVRQGNEVIDPFRPEAARGCGHGAGRGMWAERIAYRPGGLIGVGVIDRVPDYDEIKAGLPETALPEAPGAIVLWGFVFGGRAGDVLMLTLNVPGEPPREHEVTLTKDQPRLFRAWGKRAPDGGFASGQYSGSVTYLRGGVELDRRVVTFSLP